jgi:thiamine biosynthesis lipoprotein
MQQPYRWQGIVLGAKADLTLYADDQGMAAAAIDSALAEVARLEAIFSLHQPHSALNQLNRAGELRDPPFELVELLSQARLLSVASNGRFDPTIQPLWNLLAEHFAGPDANAAGPDQQRLAAARALVDWRGMEISPARIAFDRPGMQVTLNGIAQGYISDRVGDLLKGRGFTQALVNLGEMLALGRRSDGTAWQIGIPSPVDRTTLLESLELAGGAMATSAGAGMRFDSAGKFNHIIDPTRMTCADPDRGMTVIADSAAIADGLSTLGTLIPDLAQDFVPLLARFNAKAHVVAGTAGTVTQLG